MNGPFLFQPRQNHFVAMLFRKCKKLSTIQPGVTSAKINILVSKDPPSIQNHHHCIQLRKRASRATAPGGRISLSTRHESRQGTSYRLISGQLTLKYCIFPILRSQGSRLSSGIPLFFEMVLDHSRKLRVSRKYLLSARKVRAAISHD